MDLNEAKTESIKNLIESLENKHIALPEFQRDFVWDIVRTYDLFDSLVKNIFIGAVIYGKPAFEIAVREIDYRPRKGKGKNNKLIVEIFDTNDIKKKVQIDNFRIILDGQQRITSIYRALKGIDNVWFIIKNDDDYEEENDRLILNKEFHERSLEEILFEITGEEDRDRLSIKFSDVFDFLKTYPTDEETKLKYFDNLLFIGNITVENELKSVFKKFLTCLKKIQSLLTGEDRLLSYYLLDMNIDKFALFFERSNSKGISLNFTDILAAKLYAGDFNLRDKIEEFEENNTDFKEFFNREIIVRTIAYVVGDGKEKIDRGFILKKLDLNINAF